VPSRTPSLLVRHALISSVDGFSNQVALFLLVILLPLGLIAIGLGILAYQRFGSGINHGQLPIPPIPSPSSSGNGSQPPPSPQVASPDGAPSQEQAKAVVSEWLRVKSRIFAPPYDKNLLDGVVAEGPLWTDITKADGSIDWLQKNNSYYSYNRIEVNGVTSYDPNPTNPKIAVSIVEDRVLHGPQGDTPSNSNYRVLYTLVSEHGKWKIYDYKEL
jgi:hypothetical protein